MADMLYEIRRFYEWAQTGTTPDEAGELSANLSPAQLWTGIIEGFETRVGLEMAIPYSRDAEVLPTGGVAYLGYETADGKYEIRKLTHSIAAGSTTTVYATLVNNPAVTTYSAAWAARASLTYGTYEATH